MSEGSSTPLPIAPSEQGVVGYLEALTETAALGWAWRPGSNERVTVELRLDGQCVARSVADDLRDDLSRSGIGDGRHAFSLLIPETSRSRTRELRVFALSSEGAVPLDPPPSRDPAAAGLVQLQRSIDLLIGSQRLMHRNLQAALVQSAPSAGVSLADIAAAQARLQETLEAVEMFALRLEQAAAGSHKPESMQPSRRAFPVLVGLCTVTLIICCCALARAMLG